jgi:ABC-type antimicrobial peptide transport system permease subunit
MFPLILVWWGVLAVSVACDVGATAYLKVAADRLQGLGFFWAAVLGVAVFAPSIMSFGYAMLIEAGLSFLGLGVQPPTPAWGQMVGLARVFITIAPWLITYPGLAILIAVLSFNFLGDGLREASDPRLRGSRLQGSHR